MSGALANSKAMEISAAAELGDEALALLRPEMQPAQFVALMMEKALFADAVRFVSHALPKREAVWWGWMCARRASGDTPPPAVRTALEATEKWIAQPTDEHARQAHEAAERATLQTPAGCAALAAFFGGSSLAPPDLPAVPPGEFLTAKAVAGAVIFAAVKPVAAQAPEKFKQFVAQGMDVTVRIKLWPEGR